ncbi:MAG: type I pantothenate kinase [Thermoanaerobaculia bacterium]|nr:type I pantothenate kinase [Thermoanaerobaculia bacterium]
MDDLPLYHRFDHESWGQLRRTTPLTLDESDLRRVRGINERLALDEVVEIYLPLSRLLNLYVAASQGLFRATDTFLGHRQRNVPYVIGIAGSVAVGKSTTARLLQLLLSRWENHPQVDLVTTDGFLYPNRELERRGLMGRKGFPESYDLPRLLRFLAEVKSGKDEVRAPVYSHQSYDIVAGKEIVVRRPDIVIVEGLNVLQVGPTAQAAERTDSPRPEARRFPSDFFDFSLYVDAPAEVIEQWYVDRFLTLRATVFKDPSSYFHRYARLSDEEAVEVARGIWQAINGPNLRQNIRPTRERAQLILEKGEDHVVRRVSLRRL